MHAETTHARDFYFLIGEALPSYVSRNCRSSLDDFRFYLRDIASRSDLWPVCVSVRARVIVFGEATSFYRKAGESAE